MHSQGNVTAKKMVSVVLFAIKFKKKSYHWSWKNRGRKWVTRGIPSLVAAGGQRDEGSE